MAKYKLVEAPGITDDAGRPLYRVQYLHRGPWGDAGALGGYLQHESNLAQTGPCFVLGEARVSGISRVEGMATVMDRAVVQESVVEDRACIRGSARVIGSHVAYDAFVTGNACIERSVIRGRVDITDYAKVLHATVSDSVVISGHADISAYTTLLLRGPLVIKGQAEVRRQDHFVVIDPIGSRSAALSAYRTRSGAWEVVTGCFQGSLEEFVNRAQQHWMASAMHQYLAAAEIIRERQEHLYD